MHRDVFVREFSRCVLQHKRFPCLLVGGKVIWLKQVEYVRLPAIQDHTTIRDLEAAIRSNDKLMLKPGVLAVTTDPADDPTFAFRGSVWVERDSENQDIPVCELDIPVKSIEALFVPTK